MEKIKNLLKGSPIAMVVAGVLVAGLVSAAILAVYTTMLGEGNVQQSVVFGNGEIHKDYVIGNSPAIAGNTYTQEYNLLNRSETTAPIKFVTNQCIVGGGHCVDFDDSNFGHHEEGVETSYWSTVKLENKNVCPEGATSSDCWQPITGDNKEATLTYELAAPTFNFEFEATGLQSNEEYSLIYYADKQDRFTDWGGDNPGALIATFEADEHGNISKQTGSINLKMNLPAPGDWNAVADPDYCDKHNGYDDYDLCRGAKIWLVPSTEYDSGTKKVKWTNPGSYLFETDLITYDDTNADGEALYLGKGMLNFFVKNVLDVALAPGTYKVSTKVVPAR